MRNRPYRHCFAVCAYRESPYLEECLRSLKTQSVQSAVILCTSTPCAFLSALAKRYEVPLYIRTGKSSLRDDWNFAVDTAAEAVGAELVTVAHQDDRYHADYAKTLLAAADRFPDLQLFCTRYRTIGADGKPVPGTAEAVKRILRMPLRFRCLSDKRAVKRLCLRFGNSVGCPTCTYVLARTGRPLFRCDYSFVIDWDTLWRLAGECGRFVCAERELVDYRVHSGAATMENIRNHNREREETELFLRMWPRPFVRVLMHFYRKAQKAYE